VIARGAQFQIATVPKGPARLHPGITQEVAPNESQRAPKATTVSQNFLKQGFGGFQICGVKALRKLPVDLAECLSRVVTSTLI
jgi:hypothetical protein